MKTYIEERAVEVAKFMITTNATVRETAKKFGISKSTVHKDITDRVERIDPELAKSVRAVLEVNKAERHIRGGLATREKYLHHKNTGKKGYTLFGIALVIYSRVTILPSISIISSSFIFFSSRIMALRSMQR